MQDKLRPEYHLSDLQVRKMGPERKHSGRLVLQLEPDVAPVFPDVASVNEALRILIRATKANREVLPDPEDKA